MRRIIAVIVVSALVAAFASGCSRDASKEQKVPAGEQAVEEEHASMEMAFKVNGTVITRGEVLRVENMMKQQMQARSTPQQVEAMKGFIRKQAVMNLLNRELFEISSVETGVSVTEEEIDAKMEEIKGRFESEDAFREQISGGGLDEDGFRKEVASEVRINKLFDDIMKTIEQVADDDMRAYYDENIERFLKPEEVQTSHILIKVESADTDEVKVEKRGRIEKLLEEIKGGADFSELAAQNSDCPSKAKGGDLGSFARGSMVKPFEDVAFALKVGEMSGIVETQFGYHIIKSMGRTPKSTIPFEKVKEKISEFLKGQKEREIINAHLEKLRSSAAIEYADSTWMPE